jgi:hypothetical protein
MELEHKLCEYELSLDLLSNLERGSILVPPSDVGIGEGWATALRPVEQIPKPLLGKE